ncbi:EAL domain-containing protein [Agromyces sp. CFH 90414]|uniref:EAL domain-containing protein n=1 Tax=Agromyces agglutinans TaxID=2662258 RepID=A0A6I2F5G8_9MICO|nr:EAL domain-containing protein [Agromyces agglutinans]MRG59594.1 EAL domain-containing protein [Agromyces agglutinans]
MEPGASNPTTDGWVAELRRAVDRGELVAYFQPEYDLASGRPVAFEALCRWLHPDRGVIMPDRFIPVAEVSGLLGDLGRAILDQSGRRAAEWHRRGLRMGIAVNISPSQLRPAFVEAMLKIVRRLDLPRWTVTAEITETPALQESCEEYQAMQSLIDGGVGVSIDDFGAGFTSVEGMRKIPFTEVKIDRSLMRDASPAADELVARCVELARERSAVVVAEGVETSADLERAKRWRCDRAQGYYYSPAVAAEDLEPLLASA